MVDLNQPDEAIIKGKVMKKVPSEGWIFILMGATTKTMRIDEQPEPKDRLFFHRLEDPDADAIVFSLVGRDDERSEAYYLRGSWGFKQAPLVDPGKGLEA